MLQSRKNEVGRNMYIYDEINKEFSSQQARAIVYTLELFQRKLLESQTEEIIYKTRNSLSNEFATKSDLEKNILEAKLELKEDIANVEKNIANVKSELKEDIANVKEDIANVRNELKGVENTILKWVGTMFLTTITITLAGVGLMIKFL